MFRITRLIEWVVSGDPSIVLVACCELFPEPDCPVLVILAQPVLVKALRSGVELGLNLPTLRHTL